ncbi:MAG: GGDEF domain-containing protein [Aliivibrio sp.]|uniref:GGDEF domain-containing protein n=1 Tax=Aliivibrio sp. TaxID=1872443 RepID=UPI001A5A78B4|nr:GGDEF domain-containing protein [Aliivibrio sp.]
MELKDRYYAILDSLPDHVFVFSKSGTYIDVYGGAENATGFDCKSFIGKTLYDVAPLEMAEEFHSHILMALRTNKTQVVKYKFDKQDMIDLPDHVPVPQEIWFEGIITPLPITENGERTVVWMARNITKQYKLEQRLKQLSEIDDLTGVFNRRAFTQTLRETVKEYQLTGRTFSVLMLDIDRFKNVNDTFGHSYGDEVIQHTANLVANVLRQSDCFGRIGGEEFAAILFDTELEDAITVSEKLRFAVEQSLFHVENQDIKLTISIGVTQVNKFDTDIKNLMSRADKAMYLSKNTGRNKVSHYDEKVEQLTELKES